MKHYDGSPIRPEESLPDIYRCQLIVAYDRDKPAIYSKLLRSLNKRASGLRIANDELKGEYK